MAKGRRQCALVNRPASRYSEGMHNGKLLYTVLGTGAFFGLFWLGYVLAHQLGLHPVSGLILGLITGCAGLTLVSQIERLEADD